ncbi:MAG: ABC transporter permease [Clostridia bacterium]|nr:ABC transporter permease [Clostridia bacterium]
MKKFFSKVYVAFIFLFLYAPIAVLLVFSFNNSKSRAVWHGFTLKWYGELFRDEAIINAFITTLLVATLAAIIATLLGTLAAIGFKNMRKGPRKFYMQVNNIPMLNPEIVTGVSLMLLFVYCGRVLGGMELSFTTLLLAHVTFNVPYVILNVMPKLQQMDGHLYEAALDLGCKPVQAFFKVVLHEIMPGIVSGFIMAFTLSFDDFVISYFTSGAKSQTLSIIIYAMTRKRISPKINALSSIMFITVFVLLLIVNLRQNKEKNASKSKRKGMLRS